MLRQLIGLVVLLLTATVAESATYYVSNSGNNNNPGTQSQPFQTVLKGASVLQAGDTLYIRGGTYTNQFFDLDDAYANGTASSPILVSSYPGERAVFNGTRVGAALYRPKSYWIFDGMTFDATDCPEQTCGGIWFDAETHHIRVQNMDIGYHRAVAVTGSGSFHEVRNNKLHDAGLAHVNFQEITGGCYAIYFGGTDSVFEGNEIYDNTGYGVHIYSYGSSSVARNVIRNNVFYGNAFDDGTRGVSLWAIILAAGHENKAYNNMIYNNGGGIQVDHGCIDCEVYHNTVVNNPTSGNGAGGGVYLGNATGTIVRNNIFYGNGEAIHNESDAQAVIAGNLTTDPMVVNPGANDFHLQPGSPARARGGASRIRCGP